VLVTNYSEAFRIKKEFIVFLQIMVVCVMPLILGMLIANECSNSKKEKLWVFIMLLLSGGISLVVAKSYSQNIMEIFSNQQVNWTVRKSPGILFMCIGYFIVVGAKYKK
jgi:predicted Na+-dependent transporter